MSTDGSGAAFGAAVAAPSWPKASADTVNMANEAQIRRVFMEFLCAAFVSRFGGGSMDECYMQAAKRAGGTAK